jgi:hypothetical protein
MPLRNLSLRGVKAREKKLREGVKGAEKRHPGSVPRRGSVPTALKIREIDFPQLLALAA